MNLNQVTLATNVLDKSKQFYKTLGFTLIVDAPHYLRFACPIGTATFSLIQSEDVACAATTIYFEYPQLDSWVKELMNKGIEFTELPKDQAYLWREASLFDPSGNKIKLYWAGENRLNPPWKVMEASK